MTVPLSRSSLTEKKTCRRAGVVLKHVVIQSGSWPVLLGFALNEIAVFGEFADERIDLAQAQRQLRTPLQIAADKRVVIANAHFQGHGTGLLNHRWAVLLGQRQHALNAAHCDLPLLAIHL